MIIVEDGENKDGTQQPTTQQSIQQPTTQMPEERADELSAVLNEIISKIHILEKHVGTLFEYVTSQINGNVLDIYVLKCKDRLTEKKEKCERLLNEKTDELKRITIERDDLQVTLDELDEALKTSDFPHQVAAIVNDRKNAIMNRIEGLHIDNTTEMVKSLTSEINSLTQKIDALSNFIVDE